MVVFSAACAAPALGVQGRIFNIDKIHKPIRYKEQPILARGI
jgi:hypothetical protein